MASDGSVVIDVGLNSTKAEKKLAKLMDDISNMEQALSEKSSNRFVLKEKLDAATKAAKATEASVKKLRHEVDRLNDREWISNQGFSVSEYQSKVLDRRVTAAAELKEQEALLSTQNKAVTTLSAAYDKASDSISAASAKLDKMKSEAGELLIYVNQERRERELANSAMARASDYASRLLARAKKIARNVFVFSLISAALTCLQKIFSTSIKASAEASAALARLKGALLTLVAPLVQAVTPVLTELMNILAAIATEIVTIISIMSGRSIQSMQRSSKALYEQADALDKTGSAAQGAAKALASFDEINRLSSSTSAAIFPNFNFDTAPATDKLNGVFEKVNDIFRTIRSGLNVVVDDLKWSIDEKSIPRGKASWITAMAALLGATLGAAYGGFSGLIIGLSLGVLLGLYLTGFEAETWKTTIDLEDACIAALSALIGALLGGVFLGITGSVIGFSLGAMLGLYISGFSEDAKGHGKSELLSQLIVVLCALLGSVIGSLVAPGVGTVVGMGLGLLLGLSIYSVRQDPKKSADRLKRIGRSVLLGLVAGVLGVGLAALGIVSAGTAFVIAASIGLILKFFVDSIDDSAVSNAVSNVSKGRNGRLGNTNRTSVRSISRSQSLHSASSIPVYNEIPGLARGAVIPPNRKFLAVLGDQKSGTNVEAPLSTIRQAVMEAMALCDRDHEPINVNLVVDGMKLARVVVPNINKMSRAGKSSLLF